MTALAHLPVVPVAAGTRSLGFNEEYTRTLTAAPDTLWAVPSVVADFAESLSRSWRAQEESLTYTCPLTVVWAGLLHPGLGMSLKPPPRSGAQLGGLTPGGARALHSPVVKEPDSVTWVSCHRVLPLPPEGLAPTSVCRVLSQRLAGLLGVLPHRSVPVP